MVRLVGFRGKPFVEQIQILIDIGAGNEQENLEDLFALFLSPTGDRPVDEMIQHTLRDLLEHNETETIRGLASPDERIKKLCLQAISVKRFINAAPLLLHMAYGEKTPRILHEILRTMSHLQQPEFLHVFRRTVQHPDTLISCLSIKMIGRYQDVESLPELMDIVETEDKTSAFEYCSAPQAQAIVAISEIGDDDALRFLVKKIHHKNPTARRIIHSEIIKHGSRITPFIAPLFTHGEQEVKIAAATLLGAIADPNSGEVLAEALENHRSDHPYVQFVIYEALGHIPSPKSRTCLMNALENTHDALLFSVIASLDHQMDDFVKNRLKMLATPVNEQSRRIMHAMAAARALNIFSFLYRDNTGDIPDRLIEAVAQTYNPQLIASFLSQLETPPHPNNKAHRDRLKEVSNLKASIHILAVDDSSALLAFYRSALAFPHIRVTTAANGEEALENIQMSFPFDLVITDMNMPVMDGLELTQRIRERDDYAATPIVMCILESEASQQKLAITAGVSSIIFKPSPRETLLARLSAYISI